MTLVAPDAALTRDELVAVLHAENVMARRYFHPGVHRMEPYRSLFPDAHRTLPRTEEACREVLVLPTGPSLSEGGHRARVRDPAHGAGARPARAGAARAEVRSSTLR